MKKLLLIPVLLILFDVFGTVGGPKYLTFLGSRDGNLYFVLESHDQFVSPPELWKYDISNDSLSSTTDWINYPKESISAALKRNGLDSLNLDLFKKVEADSIAVFYKSPVEEYMESMDVNYQTFPMEVAWKDKRIELVQCYDKATLPYIVNQYQHRDSTFNFAVLRYRGVCFEQGYEKDTLLFSKYATPVVAKEEAVSKVEEGDQNRIMIIAIIALAVILMAIILLRKK